MNTELYDKMKKFLWLIRKQHMQAHVQAGPMGDASRGQGRILAFLKLKDGISTKDLAYLMGIRVSSLNELLAKLEKGGFIERRPDEADKRIMLNFLTAKGRQEEPQAREPQSDFLDCLNEEEQQNLGNYLDRLIEKLEAEVGSDEDWEKMNDRLQMTRERMGSEQFEKLQALRGHMGPMFHRGHGGPHGGPHCGRPYPDGRRDSRPDRPEGRSPRE